MAKVALTKAEREAAKKEKKAIVVILVDTTCSGQPGGEMQTCKLVDHDTAQGAIDFMMGLSRERKPEGD